MDYTRTQRCDLVEAKYSLVDGFVIELSIDSVKKPIGEVKKEKIIPIPTSAPVDITGIERHIQIDYSCKPNPIRTIYYTWTTEHFTILPRKVDL